MNELLVIVGIIPLIIFVIVSFLGSNKAGVWSAILSALAILIFFTWQLGEMDYTILAEFMLIVAFGGASLKLDNPLYLKLQPLFVGIALSLFLAWFQLFDKPYLLHAMDRMAKISPQVIIPLEVPEVRAMLTSLSWQFIPLILIHGIVVAVAAIKLGNLGWLLTRLAIYPIAIALMVINQLIYIAPIAHKFQLSS